MRVKPIIRMGGSSSDFDRFDPRDLEKLGSAPLVDVDRTHAQRSRARRSTGPQRGKATQRKSVRSVVPRAMTLREAAVALGVDAEVARRLAIRARHVSARSTDIRIRQAVVEQMRETLGLLVSRSRAQKMVGAVSPERFNKLRPYIRIGGNSPAFDHFHPRDLERLAARG
jgi:CYTH domain-containing protein